MTALLGKLEKVSGFNDASHLHPLSTRADCSRQAEAFCCFFADLPHNKPACGVGFPDTTQNSKLSHYLA
jgi:hypothetical protein